MHSIYVLDRPATIGRAAAADIQILDQRVSRQHARVLLEPRATTLLDLSSHNGTYVNGHKIAKRPLRHGDRFQIGVAEYIYEEIPKGELRTSGAFLSKLTTRETFGQTVVKRMGTPALTTTPTAEIPEAQLDEMASTARAERRTASGSGDRRVRHRRAPSTFAAPGLRLHAQADRRRVVSRVRLRLRARGRAEVHRSEPWCRLSESRHRRRHARLRPRPRPRPRPRRRRSSRTSHTRRATPRC